MNRVENSIDHEVNQGPREVVDSKIVIIHVNGVKAWLDFTTKLAQLTLLYASKRGETLPPKLDQLTHTTASFGVLNCSDEQTNIRNVAIAAAL